MDIETSGLLNCHIHLSDSSVLCLVFMYLGACWVLGRWRFVVNFYREDEY